MVIALIKATCTIRTMGLHGWPAISCSILQALELYNQRVHEATFIMRSLGLQGQQYRESYYRPWEWIIMELTKLHLYVGGTAIS